MYTKSVGIFTLQSNSKYIIDVTCPHLSPVNGELINRVLLGGWFGDNVACIQFLEWPNFEVGNLVNTCVVDKPINRINDIIEMVTMQQYFYQSSITMNFPTFTRTSVIGITKKRSTTVGRCWRCSIWRLSLRIAAKWRACWRRTIALWQTYICIERERRRRLLFSTDLQINTSLNRL